MIFFTLSRVPLAPVESALSLPARSTKLILLTYKSIPNNTEINWIQHVICRLKTSILRNTFTSWRYCFNLQAVIDFHLRLTLISESSVWAEISSWMNRFHQDVIKICYLFRRVVRLCVVAFLSKDDVEDCMWAAARLVHVGGSHRPAQRKTNLKCFCSKLTRGATLGLKAAIFLNATSLEHLCKPALKVLSSKI